MPLLSALVMDLLLASLAAVIIASAFAALERTSSTASAAELLGRRSTAPVVAADGPVAPVADRPTKVARPTEDGDSE